LCDKKIQKKNSEIEKTKNTLVAVGIT